MDENNNNETKRVKYNNKVLATINGINENTNTMNKEQFQGCC